jgi:hypothetical protein
MKGKPLSSLVSNVRQCNPLELGRTRITYFDISCIDNRTKRLMAPQRIAVDAAPSRARQLVQADDVLVSTVRPNLNAVALVPAEFDGEIASTGFCVLRPQPKQLCPEYLFYLPSRQGSSGISQQLPRVPVIRPLLTAISSTHVFHCRHCPSSRESRLNCSKQTGCAARANTLSN